jgi:hypothetical protein
MALICHRTNIFVERISMIELTCTLGEANPGDKAGKVEKTYSRHDS